MDTTHGHMHGHGHVLEMYGRTHIIDSGTWIEVRGIKINASTHQGQSQGTHGHGHGRRNRGRTSVDMDTTDRTVDGQGMDMDTTDRTMDGQLDTCGHHGHGQPWTDMDGHGRNMTDMDGHNNEPCMACLEGGSSCLKTGG